MAIKLKKTLYVGLGGTGVSALLKIKKCFIDSYGEIPPMIGFIAIDTDGAAMSKSVTGNQGQLIKLDSSELLACTVKGALSVYHANPKSYDWVPSKNVDKLSSIQGGGAGAVRSNGRFIAYYNNQKIKNYIQAAVTKIHRLLPIDSLYEVDTNKGIERPTDVNVFASVAGGTGSGMLIDVLAIVREALNEKSLVYKLYPWIVLPDIFRTMNSGPSMSNVLYNSYGALTTLDYIMHHNPSDPAINFGYAKIDEPLFDYAYVINNMNKAGVSFDSLDDLMDVVAKSAFLPANNMGDDLNSPFDNIPNSRDGGNYDILNKKAWAASASSAELIYDSQAVGRAVAYTIISQLCLSMRQSPTDGSADANKFFDDQHVMIRENNGRDDIINTLLSPAPVYSLQIDENTTEFDIDTYIESNCGQKQLEKNLKEALNKKLANTECYFEKYVAEIMARSQGKVDSAAKFISALLGIVNICKGEMTAEGAAYHEMNSEPQQWNALLNGVKNKGIASIFGKKVNEDVVEILQNKLTEVVRNLREEIRREWALKFYTEFEKILKDKQEAIDKLMLVLLNVANEQSRKLLNEQHNSQSKSKFQIFLHHDEVMKASEMKIDDNVKTDFSTYLIDGVSTWLGQSKEYVERKMWSFAKETPKVKEAVNTSIDSVLASMPKEQVESYLQHLKVLASPLWTYNTQGYNDTDKELDSFVIIGVGNRDTSLLNNDEEYKHFFDTNTEKTQFASTNQNDRIYVLVVEDLLPIYAVNNFSAYKYDTENKIARGYMMSNYLDEKLHNRMNAENFNVMPTIETDNVLQYWVWGFVFGYIHFDVEQNSYWIRSKSHGDAWEDFRYNLSPQRDVAYDMFKSEQLYKEVEDALNREIARSGRQPIEDKINLIKATGGAYRKEYAHLNPWEASNMDEPKFKAVKDLVSQEIKLMSE